MDEKAFPSPRAIENVVEAPPDGDHRLTPTQAERIQKRLDSPKKTVTDLVNGKKPAEDLSLLVCSKLGKPLKKAGVTEDGIAKVFADALKANKIVGKSEIEVPDHQIRLAAAGMLGRIIGYEKGEAKKTTKKTTIFGAMTAMDMSQLQTLEKTLIRVVEEVETPQTQEPVVVSSNGQSRQEDSL